MNSTQKTAGQLKQQTVVNFEDNTRSDCYHVSMVSPNDQSACTLQNMLNGCWKLHNTEVQKLKNKDFSRTES